MTPQYKKEKTGSITTHTHLFYVNSPFHPVIHLWHRMYG